MFPFPCRRYHGSHTYYDWYIFSLAKDIIPPMLRDVGPQCVCEIIAFSKF